MAGSHFPIAGLFRTQPQMPYSTTATREASRFTLTAAATWPGTSASGARRKCFAKSGKSAVGSGSVGGLAYLGGADQSFSLGLTCQTLTTSEWVGRPGTFFAKPSQ